MCTCTCTCIRLNTIFFCWRGRKSCVLQQIHCISNLKYQNYNCYFLYLYIHIRTYVYCKPFLAFKLSICKSSAITCVSADYHMCKGQTITCVKVDHHMCKRHTINVKVDYHTCKQQIITCVKVNCRRIIPYYSAYILRIKFFTNSCFFEILLK